MCGRYLVKADEKELREIIESVEPSADENPDTLSFEFKGGEIFPGDAAPVITANGVHFMTWGFPGIIKNQRQHINARIETAAASKIFGEAMELRRCIVPASAYFEWQPVEKKRKLKYEFTLPEGTPLYMAGIYTADGHFVILTRNAAPALTEIHDRMPVIIPKSLIGVWINRTAKVVSQSVTDLQFAPVTENEKKSNQLKLFT